MKIEKLSNYYSEITIRKDKDKFYWNVKDYAGEKDVEISETLYKELLKFENNPRARV